MRFVLFGPPGAGKGTQSHRLADSFALTQVSTGDLFRAAIREQTPLGVEAKGYIDRGELVPDSVTNGMVAEALEGLGYDAFILDGFPRSLPQAEWLTAHLAEHDAPLDAVVSICVADDQLVQRLSRRRMDSETGAIYHLDFNPPPADVPAERLTHRPDDQPEAIRNRLRVYHEQTQPLERYLSQHAPFAEVDGVGPIDAVQQRLLDALRSLGVRGLDQEAA